MKLVKLIRIPDFEVILATYMKNNQLNDTMDKSSRKPKYGDAAFLEYAKKIVAHPNYEGMPDPIGDRGEIQWEAPSNRQSGKFKDTHLRRREWWRQKAVSLGINPDTESTWISKTAKAIHPFGKKPCKTCGKEMDIGYAYPNEHLFKRIRKLPYYEEIFNLSEVEHICQLISRMENNFGSKIYNDLREILTTTSISPPEIPNSLAHWDKYIREVYIPSEPRMLSPGAMSNPPDRFDGFHSFNRCCRATADTGRSKENLRSYVTDRRVFEYWVDGDWISADRLMGQVRSNLIFEKTECFNAKQGGIHQFPCQADHIGPISLGFSHRPHFQLLCKSCNSGKNNRMYASDVSLLIQTEAKGETVISWFAKEIWDLRKTSVKDAETAIRLSKILRDNRHTYMSLLQKIINKEHYTFLLSLLHLETADFDSTFVGLRAVDHQTKFDSLEKKPRTTKYAAEQKIRRIRIALESLSAYHEKSNRNAYLIASPEIDDAFTTGINSLNAIKNQSQVIDRRIEAVASRIDISDGDFKDLAITAQEFLLINKPLFEEIKQQFAAGMRLVALALDAMWNADRYIRSAPDDFID